MKIKKMLTMLVTVVIMVVTITPINVFGAESTQKQAYKAFYNVLINGDFDTYPATHYYLYDVNGDGIDEMIVPKDCLYEIYYYQNGSVVKDTFGAFIGLGCEHLSIMSDNYGNTYINFGCELMYKQIYGIYSPYNGTTVDLFAYIDSDNDDYTYNVNWYIGVNTDLETYLDNWNRGDATGSIANGYDISNGIYYSDETCLSLLSDVMYDNGFLLDGTSVKIQSMTYDELISKLIEASGLYIPGDISRNNKIDLYDAIYIAQYLINARTFTDDEKKIADFNGDGKVDLYDAIGIAKYLLKH